MNVMTLPQSPAVDEAASVIVTSAVSELTKQDRCDECRSQAFGRVTMKDSGFELLWCGHHLGKYLDRLVPLASKIEDFREAINEKP